MKFKLFYLIIIVVVLGCSPTNNAVKVFAVKTCFATPNDLNQFIEFNNFSRHSEVNFSVQGTCVYFTTTNAKNLQVITATLKAEYPQQSLVMEDYLISKTAEHHPSAIFEIPKVSLPSIFDVFNRILPLVNKTNP